MDIRFYIAFFVPFFIVVSCAKCDIYADLTQEYVNTPPTTPFKSVVFEDIVPFNSNSWKLEDQSLEWQNKMRDLGRRLKEAKVGLICFVHGTFAGDDPLGLIKLFEQRYPYFGGLCKVFNKEMIRKTMGDCGNYTNEYIELFKKAIDTEIYCDEFIWNSENNHLGRLKGSIDLVEKIANDIGRMPLWGKRVLLIGHSHAGQLFALMTNFLEQAPGVDSLLTIARDGNIDISRFDEYLQKIRTVQLDYVTCGTPLRYKWGDGWKDGKYKLLNIINHRGGGFLAGGELYTKEFFLNFMYTKDGDYVQQFALAGSDFGMNNPLNVDLDGILGKGEDKIQLLKNIEVRMRVSPYGKTILVDYKDSNTNCSETLFGHGVYTRFEKMLFNTKLIVDEMY